jgi:hypothetical protein
MWKLKQLCVSAVENQVLINGKWVPARPENFKPKYCSIFQRAKYAWQVIVGKAETFTWPEGQ